MVKNLLPMQLTQEIQVGSLGQEDPLEKETAIHPSVLAWEIPWTEEPGGPKAIGLQRVGHDRGIEQVRTSVVKTVRPPPGL